MRPLVKIQFIFWPKAKRAGQPLCVSPSVENCMKILSTKCWRTRVDCLILFPFQLPLPPPFLGSTSSSRCWAPSRCPPSASWRQPSSTSPPTGTSPTTSNGGWQKIRGFLFSDSSVASSGRTSASTTSSRTSGTRARKT